MPEVGLTQQCHRKTTANEGMSEYDERAVEYAQTRPLGRVPALQNGIRCGAGAETCWCRDVRLSPAALARIRADVSSGTCLCPSCLQAEAER